MTELIKIGIVFCLILALSFRKVNLGLSLFVSTFLLGLSPERRTFVNYWFRHLWEYVVPTYPGLILAATMLGMPVRRFGWINLPFISVWS